MIFWVLCVHEIGPFMPHLSVFIEMMMRAIYNQKCIHAKKKLGRKSLNVPFVKLFSKSLFQGFSGFFMPSRFRPLIKGK